MPDASRMLEQGQWATPVPLRAKPAMPAASSLTQCAHQTSGPSQSTDSRYSAGVQPNCERVWATSSSFSARWVWSETPCAAPKLRASRADSRISSRLAVNGEHGARTIRRIENRPGSCQRSISRWLSARIAASFSTSRSGGNPPCASPTLIEPRAAWKRMPIAVAASMLSSSRQPFG